MPYQLQRKLADSIIARDSLNDIRIQLACGARVGEEVVQGLRPLHYAVYERYYECVKLLLVRGSDVNQPDDVGYTPLHLAAERGYLELIYLLIDFGASIEAPSNNKYGPDYELFPKREDLPDEPLRLAIKNDHYECAELLLQHGADPNTRYFLGAELNLTPPHRTEYMELLLRYGAYVDTFDRYGMTPLMKACKSRDCLDSIIVLLSYGANVNMEGWSRQEHRRVLHFAVIGGSLEVVLLLIKQGARVNMPADYERASPLDFAILRDDLCMIQLLLQNGGDKMLTRFSEHLGTPLHVAAVGTLSKQRQIMELLLRAGADVNASRQMSDGANLCTPLVEYLASRDTYDGELVDVLLDYGATISIATPSVTPNGILRSIRRMRYNEDILHKLLPYVGHYDTLAITTYSPRLLSDEQRALLLKLANDNTPATLKHITRLVIRQHLRKPCSAHVHQLPLPNMMISYLKFELP